MMLTVWLTLPVAEVVKAGELAIDEPDARGALEGQFRYTSEYLENPKAFPLDSLHLPLSADVFDADRLCSEYWIVICRNCDAFRPLRGVFIKPRPMGVVGDFLRITCVHGIWKKREFAWKILLIIPTRIFVLHL